MPKVKKRRSKVQRQQILKDFALIVISIVIAIALTKSGVLRTAVALFDGYAYVAIFIAGMFFTSVFTTPTSIALLTELARAHGALPVALLGGLGAVTGDYFIFRFVRDHVADDIMYLLRQSKITRFKFIFTTRLFKWFVPFLGGLIIASPLPDELGVAVLGLARMSARVFFPISYSFNTLGIFVIGWIARGGL